MNSEEEQDRQAYKAKALKAVDEMLNVTPRSPLASLTAKIAALRADEESNWPSVTFDKNSAPPPEPPWDELRRQDHSALLNVILDALAKRGRDRLSSVDIAHFYTMTEAMDAIFATKEAEP